MRSLPIIILAATAFFFFAFGIRPVIEQNAFLDIKMGESFVANTTNLYRDIFSWSATGRYQNSFRWLGQLFVYGIHQLGGLQAVSVFTAILSAIFFLTAFFFLEKIFRKGLAASFSLAFSLTAVSYEFFAPRAQTMSFLFLFLILGLLYLYLVRNKNFLLFTIPITYFWANTHPSFVFIPYLFFSFAFSYLYYQKRKEKKRGSAVGKTLAMFGIITIAITLFPPLWHKTYLTLWEYIADINLVSTIFFVWKPLAASTSWTHFLLYSSLLGAVVVSSCFFLARPGPFGSEPQGRRLARRKELLAKFLFSIPLLFIILLPFLAVKNMPFGLIALVFLIAFFLPQNKKLLVTANRIWLVIILVSLVLFLHKRSEFLVQKPLLSQSAVHFLRSYSLQGNMFNDLAISGYITYYLYPQYKEFFDSRVEVFGCCELRSYAPIRAGARLTSSGEFENAFEAFLKRYNFSYAIISVNASYPFEHTDRSLAADVLSFNPDWRLVYFDDAVLIFVKNDGKNEAVFQRFGMQSVTPFRLRQYKEGQLTQALGEYQRMILLQDSSIAREGLGQVYLESGDSLKAQEEFRKSLQIEPKNGRAYFGLGKVAISKKNNDKAVYNLRKAIELSPYLGEAYLALSRLYMQSGHKDKAVVVLQKALSRDIDFLSKEAILEDLKGINDR